MFKTIKTLISKKIKAFPTLCFPVLIVVVYSKEILHVATIHCSTNLFLYDITRVPYQNKEYAQYRHMLLQY